MVLMIMVLLLLLKTQERSPENAAQIAGPVAAYPSHSRKRAGNGVSLGNQTAYLSLRAEVIL